MKHCFLIFIFFIICSAFIYGQENKLIQPKQVLNKTEISNTILHKIKRKYLQLYLNEFVYKLNRRYFGEHLFDRLIVASITNYS
jgi:hypothetical protein